MAQTRSRAAQELRCLRFDLGRTQAEMATLIGIARNTYARYENGGLPVPLSALRHVRLLAQTTEPLPMTRAQYGPHNRLHFRKSADDTKKKTGTTP